MGYILVSRKRGAAEVELLSSRLYKQRSHALDAFSAVVREAEDPAAYLAELEVYVVEAGPVSRVLTYVPPVRAQAPVEAAVEPEAEATVEAASEPEEAEGLAESEEAAAVEAAPDGFDESEEVAAEEGVADEVEAGWTEAAEPETEEPAEDFGEPAAEEAGSTAETQEAPPEEALKGVLMGAIQEPAWGEPVEAPVEPEAEAPVEEQPPEGGAAALAAAWEAAAAETAQESQAVVESPAVVEPEAVVESPAVVEPETTGEPEVGPEPQAVPEEEAVPGVEEASDAQAAQAQEAAWGTPPSEVAGWAGDSTWEAPVTSDEIPQVTEPAGWGWGDKKADLAEPAGESPIEAQGEGAAEAAAEEGAPPAWGTAVPELEAPEMDFAAPPDLADTLGIEPQKPEKTYVPDSPMDLSVYTCEDCVFYDTCPKKGQEEPVNCGAFQWRAGAV